MSPAPPRFGSSARCSVLFAPCSFAPRSLLFRALLLAQVWAVAVYLGVAAYTRECRGAEQPSALDQLVGSSLENPTGSHETTSIQIPDLKIGVSLPPRPLLPADCLAGITNADARAHVEYLASDKLEGREAGTPGEQQAAFYIADQFKKFGLAPGGKKESFLQPCTFRAGKAYRQSANVIGILRGSDPTLKKEVVIIGAHYDHIGKGHSGAGRLGGTQEDNIFNGANDNASGVAAMLEAAQALASLPMAPDRTIIFIALGGEEKGLVGSFYYTGNSVFPMKNTVAMLNLDMVGGGKKDELFVFGGSSSPHFRDFIAQANAIVPLSVRQPDTGIFAASDHWAFYSRQIPVLFFFSGGDAQYHRAGDHADRLLYDKVRDTAKLATLVGWQIATQPTRPLFAPVPSETRAAGGRGRLGVLLDEFAEESAADAGESPRAAGAYVQAVIEGSPAEKGGILPGDIIVEFNNVLLPRKNAGAKLRELIGAAAKEKPVTVRVVRDGQLQTLTIVLGK